MSKSYKGIIFDMDGLLFDTESIYCDVHTALAPDYGIKGYDEAYYMRHVGKSDEELHEAFYTDFISAGKEAIDEFIQVTYAETERRFEAGLVDLKPGARELLDQLKEQNIPCIIASSNLRRFIDILVREAGISDYFIDIVSSEDVKRAKPDPEIVEKAVARLGLESSECLMLEDSINGVRAAYGAGVDVVVVPDLLQPNSEMIEKSESIVTSLVDVKEMLTK